MKIKINGEVFTTEQSTLSALIAEQVKRETPFAIAVNETFVAKSQYSETHLSDGDSIEILSPMQGG